MTVSRRMQAAVDMVTSGLVCADIGTDHAYVPMQLIRQGKCPRVIAMDLREGPLAIARRNIREAGMDERIQTRLSDGMQKLSPGEAQSIVICGMGGMLILDILKESPHILADAQELILQPQSDIPKVRAWLQASQMKTADEKMLVEDGKYYTLLRAVHGNESALQPEEELFGRILLSRRDPVLQDYLRRRKKTLDAILQHLMREGGPRSAARRTQLIKEKVLTEKALDIYKEN